MIAHRLPVVASDEFGVCYMFQKQEYVRVAHIGNINQIDGFRDELVMATLYHCCALLMKEERTILMLRVNIKTI